jgi:2-polyprenyl-3-methyl-5-hydroxy-6-metoxy-1,4-benzoquinol methylase
MNESYFVKRDNCPVCGSKKSESLYSCEFSKPPIKDFLQSFYSGRVEFNYLASARFELQECANCNAIWQREIPNSFLMKKLYEEWIHPKEAFEFYQERDDVYHLSGYAQEILSIILYFKIHMSRISVFDFGMGWGKWCYMAKAFGCNVYGTELSEARIEYCQKNGINVITWDEIPEYKFDFINTEQVFEHIQNPLDTLMYLSDSLKPGGLIKISVPSGKNIKKKLKIGDWMAPKGSKKSLNPVSPLEHINCFTRTSVIKMAELAGLVRVRLPLSLQIASAMPWNTPKGILKNICIPIYRNFFGTYLFFSPVSDLFSEEDKGD